VYDVAPIYVLRPRDHHCSSYIWVPILDEEDIEDWCKAICGWRERKTRVPLHATRSTVNLSRTSFFLLYMIGIFGIDRWIEYAGIFFCYDIQTTNFPSAYLIPILTLLSSWELQNRSAQVIYESYIYTWQIKPAKRKLCFCQGSTPPSRNVRTSKCKLLNRCFVKQ